MLRGGGVLTESVVVILTEILIMANTGFVGKAVVQWGKLQALAVLIADRKDCVRNDE